MGMWNTNSSNFRDLIYSWLRAIHVGVIRYRRSPMFSPSHPRIFRSLLMGIDYSKATPCHQKSRKLNQLQPIRPDCSFGHKRRALGTIVRSVTETFARHTGVDIELCGFACLVSEQKRRVTRCGMLGRHVYRQISRPF